MELWIRSQDKKLLVQAKETKAEVFVGKKLYSPNTNEEIISFDGDDKFYVIRVNSKIVGEYETEERCLEILDEIQKLLDTDPMCCLVISGAEIDESVYNEIVNQYKENKIGGVCIPDGVDYKILNKTSIVYQMPEK